MSELIREVVEFLRDYARDLHMVERFPGGETADGYLKAADLIEQRFGRRAGA